MRSAKPSQIGLIWKLRRVAAGLRQTDVAQRMGITTTRLSQIERGEEQPSPHDRQLIEHVLPPLEIDKDGKQL
jgi:transcriptional regulator with XRE-family HTH domain